MKKKRANWWWPTIVDQESAKEATKSGYFAAVFVAAATAVVATISIMLGNDMIPIDGWAYIDAVLFAVIAWRIKNYSRIFAVIGVVLFIIEKAMLAQTQGAAGWPLAIILLLMLITGARGTFAYHKYARMPENIESAT